MKNQYFILIIIANMNFCLLAQNDISGEANSEIETLIRKSKIFDMENVDSSVFFARKALNLAIEHSNKKLVLESRNRLGVALYKKNLWNEAFNEFDYVLKEAYKNDWYFEILKVQMDLGNLSLSRGQFFELDTNWSLSEASYEKALKYYEGAKSEFREGIDSIWLARIYQNIAGVHFLLTNDKEAFENYKLSARLFKKLRSETDYMDVLSGIASVSKYLGYRDTALVYYMDARDYHKEAENIKGLVVSNINLAEYYKDLDSDQVALNYLLEADSIADQLNDNVLRAQLEENLADTYGKLKMYEPALKYLKSFNTRKSEISGEFTIKQHEELDVKYETQKRETQLKKEQLVILEKDRVIYGLSFILFLAVVFLWRQQSQKIVNRKNKQLQEQENEKLLKDLEIKSMETAMDIRDAERKRIAEDLHDRLGNTLTATRMLFEASTVDAGEDPKTDKAYKLLDKAIAETRHIAYNMLSGVLVKFGLEAALTDLKSTMEEVSDLSVKVKCENIDERLNMDLELNIYRIVQELVGNALKYAKASFISISILRNGDHLMIMVKDDGKGFDTSMNGKGMGMKNINTRVQKFKGNWICESAQARGTRTEVNFKLNEEGDQDFISR